MTTNGQTRITTSGGVDHSPSLPLSLNSLSLLLFNSVNYITEKGFYKRIPDAYRKRRETPPIPNVISKTLEIVFTSPNVLLMTSGMIKLFTSPNVLNYNVRNTCIGRLVFLCVEDWSLF